jgi:membrane protease YdiL (CAAX protease family)
VSPTANNILLLILALLFFGALSIYSRLLSRVTSRGGKVRTAEFSLPDLLICVVLIGLFAAVVAKAAFGGGGAPATPIQIEQVLPGLLPFIVLLVGLGAFMRHRGMRLTRVLGLDQLPVGKAVALALGLIIAAFPLVAVGGLITHNFLQNSAKEQELVQRFREVAASSDQMAILTIFVAAVVVAPLVEEFLFRGYFYGVLKRYVGGLPSGLFTAALFAAVHTNLASLTSLFILAVCFTIAYESSGSLLVPMSMHAIFNLTQLVFVYSQAALPAQ